VDAAKEACRKIVEAGVTSVHWIVLSTSELTVAQKLIKGSDLPLRIFLIATAEVYENLSTSTSQAQAKVGGVLIFSDGYLASQTAAVSQPYVGNPVNRGKMLYTREELNELAAIISKANLQVIIHAMGDKAVDIALKAFEAVAPKSRHRYRLEQAALLNAQLIQRLKKLGIIVSIQPKVVESEFSVWSAIEHLGEERARNLFPLKTLMRNGVCVVGGSDCPMEPLNPLLGIQAATTRRPFPKERLTVEEALRLYTVNAAYATFEEGKKGSIEEGKLADFTVLSGDPASAPSEGLSDIEVEMTIIGGRIVVQKNAQRPA
jgi:predicted amidohydrolase YtcJ